MEADDHQVTTVFTVQPSFHHRHSINRSSIMKRYRRRWARSHTSPRRLPTMVTLYDSRFVECRWWNDGWTVKTVVTWRSSASMIPAPGLQFSRWTPWPLGQQGDLTQGMDLKEQLNTCTPPPPPPTPSPFPRPPSLFFRSRWNTLCWVSLFFRSRWNTLWWASLFFRSGWNNNNNK